MSTLKEKTVKGVFWTGLGTIGNGVMSFVVTVILARYLSPHDFGLIEIVLAIVAVSEMLVDCGFSQAIIKEQVITQKDLSTVFYLNFIIAAILYLIIFTSAPIIASIYSVGTSFIIILRVLSAKVIIDAIIMCQIANCNRLMQFNLLAKISIVSMFIAGVISICSIFLKSGIWSLVIYNLGASVCKAIMVIIYVRWRPTLEFSINRAKYFGRFGGSLIIAQILDKIVTSTESLLVGKKYSSADLGQFSQARKFDSLIIQTMMGVIQKVTYPAMSKLPQEERLKNSYKSVINISMFVVMPIAAFMLFFAEGFIVTVFGEQWLPAAEYLRLFSIFSLFFPLASVSKNIYMVKNQTSQYMKLSIITQCLRILVIVITIQYSLICFTWGIVALMILSTLLYMYKAGKMINYSIGELTKDNLKTIIASFCSAAIVYVAFSPEDKLSGFVMKIILGTAIYISINTITKNKCIYILKDMAFSYIKRN